MTRLSDEQVETALRDLQGWERAGDEIVRTIEFPEFTTGIDFVNRVAVVAEAADHHPDIDIRYRNVRFALSTHSEDGLTEKDMELARRINDLLGSPGQAG
jgi:4a-hydroxytetrahydrobiopterin dehydratase